MPVQHKDTCVPSSNPLQCAYYNKDHKIVNMLGYELIEERPVPAGSSEVVFTGLNGNEDDEYYIETELQQSAGGDIYLQPNADVSNGLVNARFIYDFSGAPQNGSWSSTHLVLSTCGWSEPGYTNVKAFFKAKSSTFRVYNSECHNKTTNHYQNCIISGHYNSLSSNITSLVIKPISGVTISGVVRLYRRIPLNG